MIELELGAIAALVVVESGQQPLEPSACVQHSYEDKQ